MVVITPKCYDNKTPVSCVIHFLCKTLEKNKTSVDFSGDVCTISAVIPDACHNIEGVFCIIKIRRLWHRHICDS